MIHAWQTNATQQLRRGKHDDAHISKHEGTSYKRLQRAEWFLAAESEPPVGAHVVTQRRGYTHHGIYVGASQVVHYAGLVRGLRRGSVEEISLPSFAAGHAVGVIAGVPQKFDAPELVRRARSRLGDGTMLRTQAKALSAATVSAMFMPALLSMDSFATRDLV